MTINFTEQDGCYVSQTIQGGATGIVIPHLNFIGALATLTIERTIDSSDGWATVLQTVINNAIYEDTIQGCTADVSLRIKVSALPSNAQYLAS